MGRVNGDDPAKEEPISPPRSSRSPLWPSWPRWPSCADHFRLMDVDKLFHWTYAAMGRPYAPVREFVGGVARSDATLFSDLAALPGIGQAAAAAIIRTAAADREQLWRAGALDCSGEEAVIRLLSSRDITVGTLQGGGAPLDPLFWLLHPTLERILQRNMAVGSMDLSGIPESSDDGIWIAQEMYAVGGGCADQRPTDVWPFGLVSEDSFPDGFGTKLYMSGKLGVNILTNLEALHALSPKTDALPYVYEHFDWRHCEEQETFGADALIASAFAEQLQME